MTDPTVSVSPPDFMARASALELEQWAADVLRQAKALRDLPPSSQEGVQLERDVQIASLEEFGRQCDSAALVKRLAEWEARRR